MGDHEYGQVVLPTEPADDFQHFANKLRIERRRHLGHGGGSGTFPFRFRQLAFVSRTCFP